MNYNAFEAVPFIGILLSISFWPLINQEFWHKHVRPIIFSWCIFFLLLELFCHGVGDTCFNVAESMIKHYIPFVLLIASLFIATGGIYVDFPKLKHGAVSNTGFLFTGSLLAGWIGTTGAASLLIRPFLRLNDNRKYRTHLVIFFIILIANIGGVASPIGDPPLFLGYLEGIDFFWPIKNLWMHLLGTVAVVCAIFFCIDKYLWTKEEKQKEDIRNSQEKLIILHGKRNIFLLMAILACLILCNFEGGFNLFGLEIKHCALLRDGILLLICFIGSKFASKIAHRKNEFSYLPLIEVVETFFAIFLTVAPVLDMLAAGKNGPFAWIFNWIAQDGDISLIKSFWSCGLLSSVLDNSPTFLIFFYMAGGNALALMTEHAHLLGAIMIAAVFMGALTYIGNAPNFVVKSIANSNGVEMPGFIKYALIVCGILFPVFIIISLIL